MSCDCDNPNEPIAPVATVPPPALLPCCPPPGEPDMILPRACIAPAISLVTLNTLPDEVMNLPLDTTLVSTPPP